MPEGNSNYEKRKSEEAEANKLECVVQGKVKEKKKSVGRRISEFFFESNGKDVLSYLVEDVIRPRAKDILYDIIVGGADAKIYGRGRKRRSSSSSYERDDYENRFKTNRRSSSSSRDDDRPRRRGVFDLEAYFDDRQDAQNVLDAMEDRIKRYQAVTIGDYYDLLGKTCPGDYTTADYGWDNLDDVNVRHDRNGYYIDLPKPIHLD